jgi:hypothetical protein
VNPVEHDTQIAALYHTLEKAKQQRAYKVSSLMRVAGYDHHYFGRSANSQGWAERVFENERWTYRRKSLDDAMQKLRALSEEQFEKKDLTVGHSPQSALKAFREADETVAEIEDEISIAEEAYTGWSRFFLVTSSQGHIHSSMHCSSCRPTTTFGWLPQLSGKEEEEAVKAHGPALCSVCFPSAPVEWTSEKVKKAAANKAVA